MIDGELPMGSKKLNNIFLALFILFVTAMFWDAFSPDHSVKAQGNVPSQYVYISTATTTTVKPVPGYLTTVTINGGTAGVVTLFDIGATGCTGTPGSGKFATIEAIAATNPTSLQYNLRTLNGICVVTAAATDVTISFN